MEYFLGKFRKLDEYRLKHSTVIVILPSGQPQSFRFLVNFGSKICKRKICSKAHFMTKKKNFHSLKNRFFKRWQFRLVKMSARLVGGPKCTHTRNDPDRLFCGSRKINFHNFCWNYIICIGQVFFISTLKTFSFATPFCMLNQYHLIIYSK